MAGPCLILAIAVGVIILISAVGAQPNTTQPTPTTPPTPIHGVHYRLPSNINPIHYEIILQTDPRNVTFNGECFIEIQALKNTRQILLHIMNLNISLSEYYKKNTTVKTGLPKATPNSLTDIVVYNLNEELQANVSYILHYEYVGIMNEDVRGFYRSKYTTSGKVTKWISATEFEPTHARCVFPCLDEPKFKATFKISLNYDDLFKSMGPTIFVYQQYSRYRRTVKFDTTSIMSTFGLFFAVSELDVSTDDQFGIIVRHEYSSQTSYSYECGKNLYKAFCKYFDTNICTIPQNLIHLDAVPNSEVRESLLLYDNKQSTLKSKQVVANIVAYQVAHLFWGIVVTCEWWSYTWLNVGFATYYQYFGTNLEYFLCTVRK